MYSSKVRGARPAQFAPEVQHRCLKIAYLPCPMHSRNTWTVDVPDILEAGAPRQGGARRNRTGTQFARRCEESHRF